MKSFNNDSLQHSPKKGSLTKYLQNAESASPSKGDDHPRVNQASDTKPLLNPSLTEQCLQAMSFV